mgnify:CR=1 FL=1
MSNSPRSAVRAAPTPTPTPTPTPPPTPTATITFCPCPTPTPDRKGRCYRELDGKYVSLYKWIDGRILPWLMVGFTVIAALMPMAFVTGLMGPYMRPIPINASVGMLLSLLIALVVTPWLSLKLLARHAAQPVSPETGHGHAQGTMAARLHRLFERVMHPFLATEGGARRRALLFAAMAALVALAAGLAVAKLVVLKMLPFDNKSELQIVVDLPEGRTLEDTNALLAELSAVLDRMPEVRHYQGYAGTAASNRRTSSTERTVGTRLVRGRAFTEMEVLENSRCR